MHLVTQQDATDRSTHAADGSSVAVLFGGRHDSMQVGMVRLTLPPGARMPSHRHGGSDVIVTPVTGRVCVLKGEQSIELEAGDALLIMKYESVSLTNPYSSVAQVLVAAGPAAFTSDMRHRPHRSFAVAT